MTKLRSQRVPIGARPALLVVDASNGFADPGSPLGCDGIEALRVIARLLLQFREQNLPVVFTTTAYADASEALVFRTKLPLLDELVVGGWLSQIHVLVEPRADEPILRKIVPSAFFDSSLRQRLFNLGVDTVFVTGFTTSGCVRATAVDALSSNLRLIVVRDGCADRDAEAHLSNLRDLDLKYGEVVSLTEALNMLSAVQDNL